MDSTLRYEHLVSRKDGLVDAINNKLPENMNTYKSYAYPLRGYILLSVLLRHYEDYTHLHKMLMPLGYHTFRGTMNYHIRQDVFDHQYAAWDKNKRWLSDIIRQEQQVFILVTYDGLLNALKLQPQR